MGEANPKPSRGVNWVGNPMKEGDNYWGGNDNAPPAQQVVAQPDQPPDVVRVRRKAKGNPKAWSPEAREAYSKRMKAWWQAKKAKSTTGET